jgi:hypothetical protein
MRTPRFHLATALAVATALPGSSRKIALRTDIPKSTVARVIRELQAPPPDGFGIVLDATGAVADWGILNPERL